MERSPNNASAEELQFDIGTEVASSHEIYQGQASGTLIFDKHSSEYIFIRRDNIPTIPWPNMIGIVGGGMDVDESPEEACRREVGEELWYRDTTKPVSLDSVRPLLSFVNSSGTLIHMHMTELEDTSDITIGDEGEEIVRLSRTDMISAAKAGEFADDFNQMILTLFPET
jgi:8-oxo-dGTP diphosphatase